MSRQKIFLFQFVRESCNYRRADELFAEKILGQTRLSNSGTAPAGRSHFWDDVSVLSVHKKALKICQLTNVIFQKNHHLDFCALSYLEVSEGLRTFLSARGRCSLPYSRFVQMHMHDHDYMHVGSLIGQVIPRGGFSTILVPLAANIHELVQFAYRGSNFPATGSVW